MEKVGSLKKNWKFGKGVFKYYVIKLRGVGGLDQNDDNDDAFRGGGGVWDLNDDMMTQHDKVGAAMIYHPQS